MRRRMAIALAISLCITTNAFAQRGNGNGGGNGTNGVQGTGTPGVIPVWLDATTLTVSPIATTNTGVEVSSFLGVSGQMNVDDGAGNSAHAGGSGVGLNGRGTYIGLDGTGTSIGVRGSGDTGVEAKGVGVGVSATSQTSVGIQGTGPLGGVTGQSSADGPGVLGLGGTGIGVEGYSNLSTGVMGTAQSQQGAGVFGQNLDPTVGTGVTGVSQAARGLGVHGQVVGQNAIGVLGQSPFIGVLGQSATVTAVQGETQSGNAVLGISTAAGNAIFGLAQGSGFAGLFQGRVSVNGNLHVNGTLSKSAGSFKIDQPLDPANRYLSHSFVESPDMKNIYDGVAVLDEHGRAVVVLPEYFEALNSDFRYQLTTIGGYAPVFVESEIASNRFAIGGGSPGMKVSWQVTGTRQDAYARLRRIPVEEDKPADQRGQYLNPDAFALMQQH